MRHILDSVLGGCELSTEDAITLCGAEGDELEALRDAADRLRAEQVGDTVGYVVNRNVNFTNVCVKSCKFCAFSRARRSEESYFVDLDEVVRRAVEARDLGATEICIQAGLAPGMDGRYYIDLCRAVKAAAPELHVHAFSPEEIKYGASRSGMTFRDYLAALRDVGLGSLPGTSAEILDDGVRARISPGRITTAEWIDVITSAHRLGIPTTSTLMFGHVETDGERMRHLALLRTIQQETGGFTEIVPLSFVHHEAPLFARRKGAGVRPGATDDEIVRLYAITRLMLGATFRNVQASWVKQGLPFAARLLRAGANDLGGTLINESISTAAGAAHGQLASPRALRDAIRAQGRAPVQRNTLYRVLRRFEGDGDDLESPLDHVVDAEATFGSYRRWTADASIRFSTRAPARVD